MKVEDLISIRIKLASPQEILSWSKGEVTKPETINYRTQRAEKDGLFCEIIFGPEKDYQCYCGKYKGYHYKGIVCDRCKVEIGPSSMRRERLGHIKLAVPVAHIWYLRGVPSRMGQILDIPAQQLEKVIYYVSYIITEVNEKAKEEVLEEIEKEYKEKLNNLKSQNLKEEELKAKIKNLEEARERAKEELSLLKPLQILSEIEYRNLSLKYGKCFRAGTGAKTLKKIFEKIDLDKEISKLEKSLKENTGETRKKILQRLKLFKSLKRAKIRPEWMFLEILPVLPADLRPVVQLDGGRYASSDLNDLYRRVINRNNRLKYLLEIGAPEVIVRNEERLLQEAVDSLIDNEMRKGVTTKATTGGRRLLKSLADMLKGKQGRFRQNLLGKRVDYSGRSVIVVGPELKLEQIGLPKRMALELFKPFVVRKLLEKEIVYNVRAGIRLIEDETDEVWSCLEEVVKDKLVLANRAPTLHRLSIQAFYPVLIEGEAIRIHPMVCKAYNADFDGDQMAIYLPLSEKAQREAKERMLSSLNLLKPATGTPIVTLYQDIVLGCYYLTYLDEKGKGTGKAFDTVEEVLMALEFGDIDLRAKIKFRNPKSKEREWIETTAGRIIFNEVLPPDFPFQNFQIKIKNLEKIVATLLEKYPKETIIECLDKIKDLGFEYSTLSGISFGMDDLILPKNKQKIIEEAEKEKEEIEKYFEEGLLSQEEKRMKIIELWSRVKSRIGEEVLETFSKEKVGQNPIFQMVDAGARGSWAQPIQMCGMKGLVVNPAGEIIELPIKNSYKEGLKVLEYFISTHGARKGTADTALRTSSAGYLTRRLIDVAHDVIVREEDCGTKEGIEIWKEEAEEVGQDFLFKIVGRVVAEDIKDETKKLVLKKGEVIDWEKAKEIIERKVQKIKVRSPLTCKTLYGVCQKCYGFDLGRNKMVEVGEAVGIVAAQSIGEPGTQLTMRTFHTGGVFGVGDITSGLPTVQEIFEVRTPSNEGIIAEKEGKVIEVNEKKGLIIETKDKKTIHYPIYPGRNVLVKKGEKVEKGQLLIEGIIDLKKLAKLKDKKEVAKYMIKELQRVYCGQGVAIHDKHFEIIVRQMFSRVRIKEPGDSFFTPGEIVEKSVFIEENRRLKKEGKKPAKAVQLLLGISRVALSTSSFLSAASFQETSRVLIKASLEGAEDKLRGLKENVILGKLIPAGTGFKK
jgi:DNA-directed RNA polymerase subunit beta'